MRKAAVQDDQIAMRMGLARLTSDVFTIVGNELHAAGHLVGTDRRDGKSPFGHGDDRTVAVAMLLRIAGELVSVSSDTLNTGRHYAGSALVRQLVEVEYLAWAFETNNEDASRWLRSTKDERLKFFSPAKLRAAADGRFRSIDYSYHCELGGHPVPGSWVLLNGDVAIAQLMLSDCLGHAERIWVHTGQWASDHGFGGIILKFLPEMAQRYAGWHQQDDLLSLPPPPDFPRTW
jgi:hypothetical protein